MFSEGRSLCTGVGRQDCHRLGFLDFHHFLLTYIYLFPAFCFEKSVLAAQGSARTIVAFRSGMCVLCVFEFGVFIRAFLLHKRLAIAIWAFH